MNIPYPVEFGVKDGHKETRMVLASDYATLRSKYFALLCVLQDIKDVLEEGENGL
jgi:hypothetical protein